MKAIDAITPHRKAPRIKPGSRLLSDIAAEITADWKTKYFGALPYLNAMRTLSNISDAYGDDSGESIVAYFLANASTWKGEVARRVKKELNAMLKAAR